MSSAAFTPIPSDQAGGGTVALTDGVLEKLLNHLASLGCLLRQSLAAKRKSRYPSAQATEIEPSVGLPLSALTSASSWPSTPLIFFIWPELQSDQRLSSGLSAPS